MSRWTFTYSMIDSGLFATSLFSKAKRVLIALLTAGLLSIHTVFADPLPSRIDFQHLLENKDIPLGEARAFLQDKQGFMWIGGQGGLLRYDGYEFKFVLKTVKTAKGSDKRPAGVINHLYQDKDQILWVSTRTGLLRYDPRTELLEAVPDYPGEPQLLSIRNVQDTVDSPTGELIVASEGGLFLFDRKTLKYSVILPDSTKENWLANRLIRAAYFDEQGILWLGTGAGLERVDLSSMTFTLFQPYPERPDHIQANTVNDFAVGGDGTFWLGTTEGVVHFDPKTQARKRYMPDPSDPHSIKGTEIAKMMFDSEGALWIASDGGGVAVFERSEQFPEGRFINHLYEPGRSSSLNSNQVRTVYEDRAGDVWVGNYPEGVNYFDRTSVAITTYTTDQADPFSLSHNSVLAVRADDQNNLWLGTDGGGLNFYDRKTGHFTRFQHDPNDPTSISGNAILDVFIADDGRIWSGTWAAGVSVLDPKTGQIERLPFDGPRVVTESVTQSNRLKDSTVWAIVHDKDKNLWFGNHANGLSMLDRNTGIYTHYSHLDNDPKSITAGVVWSILEDSMGMLWVGTATGLDLLDRKTGTFTHFVADPNTPGRLANPSVFSLYEDHKQRLWVGTGGGLHLMDRKAGTFKVYDTSKGLLNNAVRTIFAGPNGLLWLGTGNGISVFDPETERFKNYNRNSGRLLGVFHTDSGLATDSGEVVFGGVSGLRIIDPEKLTQNKAMPLMAFTGLSIFADAIEVGGADGLISQSLNHTDTIVLDYQKSTFQFNYAALNFRDAYKTRYAYKLDGFDKEWLEVGEQRAAKYTNLNPGTYVLNVKSSTSDGGWSDERASITIVQLPPPWRTWWAYTLYVLMILMVIAWFIHTQRRKRHLVEQQNRLLEMKVAERTLELRQKNNDIQAMLMNMRQGLFTIEPGGKVHPEYSHFLKEIFETENIAGTDALELLFANALLGSNERSQIKEAVFAVIGEDELNFGFNSHLFIHEYQAELNGNKKYLSLDWSPIVDNDVVVKLMVSVRDVTQLKKMEEEALSKKRELGIISQLLNIPAKKYLSFAGSAKRYIAENRSKIEHSERCNEALLTALFSNMHTIKGNCRTFGFNDFSNVVHDVESVYSELRKTPNDDWDREKLLADLLRVEAVIQEYERVYYTVLGRGDSAGKSRDSNGFWGDIKAVDTILQCIESTHTQYPMVKNTQPLLPIQILLDRAMSSPITEVLEDVILSLGLIAAQLEKEEPEVIIESNHVRIKSTANELVSNVFVHILRNSIDHGIEHADMRLQAGKPVKGIVQVRSAIEKQKLLLYVRDDGQGLNIQKLFQRGVALKLWSESAVPSYADVANLIFYSGVSTKEQVTEISGRGVGMAAVKTFLEKEGGNIRLQLLGDNAAGHYQNQAVMIPFELIIELPNSTFTVIE